MYGIDITPPHFANLYLEGYAKIEEEARQLKHEARVAEDNGQKQLAISNLALAADFEMTAEVLMSTALKTPVATA